MQYFCCINWSKERLSVWWAGGQTDGKHVGLHVKCVWFFSACVCACLTITQRESVWVCEPPSWRRSLYLVSAGSDWRADSLHIFLTPLCSPTPDGHSSVPYHSDDLWNHCCGVKPLWSQAGNTGAEKNGMIVSFYPPVKTHLKLDNWGDDAIFNWAFHVIAWFK